MPKLMKMVEREERNMGGKRSTRWDNHLAQGERRKSCGEAQGTVVGKQRTNNRNI